MVNLPSFLDYRAEFTDFVAFAAANAVFLLDDMSFSYDGPDRNMIIDGLDLEIKEGKITAVVGASGSGKSTLC